MRRIQCTHPPHHHSNIVATSQLWTASGRFQAPLVLEPIECSTSTKLAAEINKLKQKLVPDIDSAQESQSSKHNSYTVKS